MSRRKKFQQDNKEVNVNSGQNEIIEESLAFEMTEDMSKTLDYLKKEFQYPLNQDLVLRNLYLDSLDRKAVLLFMEGMVSEDIIHNHIIKPLMEAPVIEDIEQDVADHILTIKNVKKIHVLEEIADLIIAGNTILLVEGSREALSIESVKFEHRGIEKPTSENVIKGPQEGFVESGSINRGLIRKQLKSKKLVTEKISIGRKSKDSVYIMYIGDLASPDLIKEVKERIEEIEVDSVLTTSVLEQHIEERPYSLVPTVLSTERPDRVVAFLLEGHVTLLMDTSPRAIVVPVTFWSFFHTPEDIYQRWFYGNFIRIVRWIAIFIALLTPAVYLSIANYHPEMIPTDLILAIGGTRETVPFPVFIELVIMEIGFELLREAGIRIPTPIGPTIGIVGALILGQAAVEAGIVSPILVIVVAITGLASFCITDSSLNYSVRILRFGLLILASLMGLLGVAVGLVVLLSYLTTAKSFEVPFFAPMTPHYPSSKDMLVRPPVWRQWLIPQHLRPQQRARKKRPEGKQNQ